MILTFVLFISKWRKSVDSSKSSKSASKSLLSLSILFLKITHIIEPAELAWKKSRRRRSMQKRNTLKYNGDKVTTVTVTKEPVSIVKVTKQTVTQKQAISPLKRNNSNSNNVNNSILLANRQNNNALRYNYTVPKTKRSNLTDISRLKMMKSLTKPSQTDKLKSISLYLNSKKQSDISQNVKSTNNVSLPRIKRAVSEEFVPPDPSAAPTSSPTPLFVSINDIKEAVADIASHYNGLVIIANVGAWYNSREKFRKELPVRTNNYGTIFM